MLLRCITLLLLPHTVLQAQVKNPHLLLRFVNKANGKPIVLLDSAYSNNFEESYQLTRLKYYISDICLAGKQKRSAIKNIFLLDAAGSDTAALSVKTGTYNSLRFKLGVDSILNCSGAQAGALDPLNGMFWTWNSGYVFFKLEGYSASSTADLQRIEHHIGGYQGSNKASKEIELILKEALIIKEGDHREITIEVNLDRYWKGQQELKIASNALIMSPGDLAKKSSQNFQGMFSIAEIK
ncbi:MAG: hypothetical protein H7X88_01445 [Gloeobacteraceae cyanobacterium ES-bin-316]|nr:hypothetical protein [Ferruginibacter sp.]